MNAKTIILGIGLVLLGIGIFKPNLPQIVTPSPVNVVVDNLKLIKPGSEFDSVIPPIIKALSTNSDRKTDGKKLASLFNDMSTLVLLDGEDLVITNTDEIRQANKLAGPMLRMDIKGKYEDLPEALQSLMNSTIGDDNIPLTSELRTKAADAFKALAWACNEGSK
jgi:hypothetical protein